MIDLCIILPSNNRNRRPASFMSKGYMARRLAINYSVPLVRRNNICSPYISIYL
jgi:carbamoyl-phosphate synthase/aspartate carbamoyltransferase